MSRAARLPLLTLLLATSCADAGRPPRASRSEPAPESVGQQRSLPARVVVPGPQAAPAASVRDDASLKILRAAVESSEYSTRLTALEAIADARLPEGVEWLAHALGDPEHDVRVIAVDALGDFEGPRRDELLRSVRDDETEALDIRALAAGALVSRPERNPCQGGSP